MRVFKKQPFKNRSKTVITHFSGFHLTERKKGVLCASESKNCEIHDGILMAGLGGSPWKNGEGYVPKTTGLPMETQFFYIPGLDASNRPMDEVGAIGLDNGVFYLYDTYSGEWVSMHTFSKPVRNVYIVDEEGVRRSVFIGEEGLYLYTYGDALTTTEWKNLGNKAHLACSQQGRLFFVEEPYTIRYSAPFNARDIAHSLENGGGIKVPSDCGEIIDLVAFDEKVYIFYEKGIAYLKPSGFASDFVVRTVPYRYGRIYPNSIGVCGTRLFFLTEHGLCAMKKDEIKRVCTNLPIFPNRENIKCSHSACSGRFLLVYKGVDSGDKCVVAYEDQDDGYFSFTPSKLSDCIGTALCGCDGKIWQLWVGGEMPNVGYRRFTVKELPFEEKGARVVTKLRFEGEGSIWVTFKNDENSQSFLVTMSKGIGEKTMRTFGKNFSITLELEDNTLIRTMSLESSMPIKD